MAKVYIARHQVIGFLTQFPFASHPSAEQLAALEKLCFQSAGAAHPKTKEQFWIKVDELDVLGPNDVPVVPEHALSAVGAAGMAKLEVSAVGTVTPPKGK